MTTVSPAAAAAARREAREAFTPPLPGDPYEIPAAMLDVDLLERRLWDEYEIDSVLAMSIVHALRKSQVLPEFESYYKERRNGLGQSIGPVVAVDPTFAAMMWEVTEAARWPILRVIARWRREMATQS